MKYSGVFVALLCSMLALAACSSDDSGQSGCDGGVLSACAPPLVCTGTMRDCKNGAADGCETDVASDVNNCGGCHVRCPLPANGTPGCSNSLCGIKSCNAPYQDCNHNRSDGCETDTLRDAQNCGGCGVQCPGASNAAGACVRGQCAIACNAPYLDCNNDPSDGCEINGGNDLQNCGTCGNQCPNPQNGIPACAAGTCIVSACTPPFRTCQMGPINQCETNTSNDLKNCGTCNKQCPNVANGTPACKNSVCGIGSCNPLYLDCDSDPSNGCEINGASDSRNCGMCGRMCPAGSPCVAGSCLYAPSGPQTNVPVSTVTGGGWTQCYLDSYSGDLPVATVLAACTKPKLMLACRTTSNTTLQLLAWAPRTDVIFDTARTNTPHDANGAGWYYSATWSWGFAPQGDAIQRNSCDIGVGTDVDLRLCWHTGQGIGGFRCGNQQFLQGTTTHERLVYQAD